MRIYANMPRKERLKHSLMVIAGIDNEIDTRPFKWTYELVEGHEWYEWYDDELTIDIIKKSAVETIMDAFAAITGED